MNNLFNFAGRRSGKTHDMIIDILDNGLNSNKLIYNSIIICPTKEQGIRTMRRIDEIVRKYDIFKIERSTLTEMVIKTIKGNKLIISIRTTPDSCRGFIIDEMNIDNANYISEKYLRQFLMGWATNPNGKIRFFGDNYK